MNKISKQEAEQIARLMRKRDIVLGKINYLTHNKKMGNKLNLDITGGMGFSIHEKNLDFDFLDSIEYYYSSTLHRIECELKELGVNIDEK